MSDSDRRLDTVGDDGSHRGLLGKWRGSARDWELRIHGAVENPQSLTLAALEEDLPTARMELPINCVSSGTRIYLPKGEPARFTGFFLDQLLERISPTADAKTVVFISRAPGQTGPASLRHETMLELDLCKCPRQVMLATSIDHGSLEYENGWPLRSVVDGRGFDGSGRYFYKSLKWLSEIELISEPVENCLRGTWEQAAGYSIKGRIGGGGEKIIKFVACGADDKFPEWLEQSEWGEFLDDLLAGGDLSHLVCGRLHRCNIGLFTDPRWKSSLRFWSGQGATRHACQMRGTDFGDSDFARRLDGQGWDFSHNNLSLSVFNKARLGNEDPALAATLYKCDCEGASFRQADLRHTNFGEAYLASAKFNQADLQHANLAGANLVRADLRHANMRNANVQGVDFRHAQVDGLQLGGASGLTETMAELLARGGALEADPQTGSTGM